MARIGYEALGLFGEAFWFHLCDTSHGFTDDPRHIIRENLRVWKVGGILA